MLLTAEKSPTGIPLKDKLLDTSILCKRLNSFSNASCPKLALHCVVIHPT